MQLRKWLTAAILVLMVVGDCPWASRADFQADARSFVTVSPLSQAEKARTSRRYLSTVAGLFSSRRSAFSNAEILVSVM